MVQQIIIPKTAEEVAASLVGMDREKLCIVKGFILGIRSQYPEQARGGERREGA